MLNHVVGSYLLDSFLCCHFLFKLPKHISLNRNLIAEKELNTSVGIFPSFQLVDVRDAFEMLMLLFVLFHCKGK